MTDAIVPISTTIWVFRSSRSAPRNSCASAPMPPFDHPHVYCDMGDDNEYICPYCSTLYRHDPKLAPNAARPAECALKNEPACNGPVAARPAHRHRYRRRHRRFDGFPRAGTKRLSRPFPGAGRAAGRNRCRDPALAQCDAHIARSWARRPAAPARRCAAGRARTARRAADARSCAYRSATCRAALWRAYWMIHRGDLQAALRAAASAGPRHFHKARHADGGFRHPSDMASRFRPRGTGGYWTSTAQALIAADGLWSKSRAPIGFNEPPRFAGRTAWRALIPREGRCGGISRATGPSLARPRRAPRALSGQRRRLINIVVITDDSWNGPGWSEPASRVDLLRGFPPRAGRRKRGRWSATRDMAEMGALRPQAAADAGRTARWRCLGMPPIRCSPILAQGAAMAIEDAAVAAQCLARMPDDAGGRGKAIRQFGGHGPAWCSAKPRRNGARYHLRGLHGYAAEHGDAADGRREAFASLRLAV